MENTTALTAPNGCRWCGTEERVHCSVYKEPVGYHTYVGPDDAMRKQRLLARRNR